MEHRKINTKRLNRWERVIRKCDSEKKKSLIRALISYEIDTISRKSPDQELFIRFLHGHMDYIEDKFVLDQVKNYDKKINPKIIDFDEEFNQRVGHIILESN